MLIKAPLVAIFVAFCSGLFAQSVVINEVMTANPDAVMDEEFTNFSEWVELYNPSADEVNLSGWYLSDDALQPNKWPFPENTKIYSGRYLLIWMDKMDIRLHTNFRARGDNELIVLSDPSGIITDSIRIWKPARNYTFGRFPDGSNEWDTLAPTPEQRNQGAVPGRTYPAPVPNMAAGRFESAVQITFTNPYGSGNIHYTLDGSTPTSESAVYSNPLNIASTTTVRARIIGDDLLPGIVRTSTYFIDERPFTLPVVSISTNPEYFFSPQIGIYVVGENGIMGCSKVANYNRDWERPLSFEYFAADGNRKFNLDAGVQVSGNCSRGWEQKSLAIVFRDKYGKSKINYPFFADKSVDRFKTVLLRNSGNDFNETHFRDGLMHSLVIGQMDVDALGYSPAAVYLNGSYWGLLNIREKPNEDYFYTNYGLDEDSVDFLENNGLVISGDNQDYVDLVDYLSSHSLSGQEAYDYVESRVDIESYINYQFTELFYGNIDWPGNNNRYWKSRRPGSKWRWILYDLDLGFGLYTPVTHNMLEYATVSNSTEYNNPPWSTLLFRKLLENDTFRNRFIDMATVYLGTTFRPERTGYFTDSIASMIQEEMYFHNIRWDFPPQYWSDKVEKVRDFGRRRPGIMTGHLAGFFDLREAVPFEVRTNYREKGLITMNEVLINDTVFKGNYFMYRPIQLQANDHKSLVFDHWEITRHAGTDSAFTVSDTSAVLRLVIWTPTMVCAVYNYRAIEEGILINEFCASDSPIADEYGDYDDWIEIVNMGNHPVNLAGFFLTDNMNFLNKWQIPGYSKTETTIPAGGYKLFWADGEPEQGPLHVDFKLSRIGGHIGLSQTFHNQTVLLDHVYYTQQSDNSSYGRYKDGTDHWFSFSILTPGIPNELEVPTGNHPPAETAALSLYPNPMRDQAQIVLTGNRNDTWQLSLFNTFGRLERSWLSQPGTREINVEGLADGVYLLRANNGKENFILRIVKLK